MLFDAIITHWPRELRDMMYAILWNKDLSQYNHAPGFKRSSKELEDRVAALENERPW